MNQPRPAPKRKKKEKADMSVATVEEQSEFKRLNKIVRRGVEAFMDCGNALIAIQDKQL